MTANDETGHDADWPRLLLLSEEGPQTATAGGILLYRLLKDYPSARLRIIEHQLVPGRTRLDCGYQTITPRWRRLEQSRLNRWHRTLRCYGLVPPVPPAEVDRLLDGFSPQVVVCVMQFSSFYEIAWNYARQRDLPFILIVHDVNEVWERVFPWARGAQRRRDGTIYRDAARRLCISPEMEDLYARLYGAPGEVLYPNRSEALEPRPPTQALALKSPGCLTVAFAGNLNYGYGAELLRLLPAFRQARARIVIYSVPPGPACAALLQATDCVDYRGFAPSSEEVWSAVKGDCDAVILPYPNPAGEMETLCRHHFPSKLPEYLALGMPVIVTGPDFATGVRWALRNPAAVAVQTASDPAALCGVLDRLRDDAGLRLDLATNGVAAGNRDFDPQRIKSRFLAALRDGVDGRARS